MTDNVSLLPALSLSYWHQFSSVTQSGPTLCNPMDCSMPVFPVHHNLLEFTETHVHQVGDAIHLILCGPLLLLPSIFPSIRAFSNESVLHIRWPKYWSFRFSISPSSEYSGLISFRMDWLDVLAVQGTLSRVFSNTTVQKHQVSKILLNLSLQNRKPNNLYLQKKGEMLIMV